jgi:hypothetical protein
MKSFSQFAYGVLYSAENNLSYRPPVRRTITALCKRKNEFGVIISDFLMRTTENHGNINSDGQCLS